MRFSEQEWEQVEGRARDAGMAVGAWIGQVAVDSASGRVASVGLPDLLRLHADVVRMAGADGTDRDVLDDLVRRLDAAVDAAVAEAGRCRR